MKPTTEERFWTKVNKAGPTMPGMDTPCWTWTGRTVDSRYGHFTMCGKERRAHRVAWEYAYGPIPIGLEVCHRCDNRGCVNAVHLFLGTHLENMRDMEAKGRGNQPSGARHGWAIHPDLAPKGEQHGQAKLTAAKVADIRAAYASGAENQYQLAKRFGVNQATIWRIVHGKTWTHLLSVGASPALP